MGKNKIGIIIIIILILILLLLFSVGFFILFKTINKAPVSVDEPSVVETILEEDITIVPIGESSIVTNLLQGSDNKSHVIKINASLGVNNSKKTSKEATKFIELVSTKQVFIRDIIIGICRSKTFEELNRNDGQEILKSEIKNKINEEFETELVVKVYIDDMILD